MTTISVQTITVKECHYMISNLVTQADSHPTGEHHSMTTIQYTLLTFPDNQENVFDVLWKNKCIFVYL